MFDVAIVGFGPSGAVAAGLLGRAGLSTYVCDRSADVYSRPRAIALDHEIMRVFQQLGVVDAIRRWVEPFTPSEYFGVDGQLIRRMTMVAPPYPLGHTPSLVFSQPPVEGVLRAHATSLPGVTVELGTTVETVEQNGDHATVRLRAPGGVPRTVQARYVIGCDGAASTVRAALGIELDDLGFDEPWLVIDVLVNTRGQAKLPRTSVQYCEPARPCTLVIGPGNHRRWEISLKEGEDPVEAATPEGAWRHLSRWLTPEDGELWRQASYRFHALIARDWRRGRIFLAGDAAHQQPPFLGQGMCQGIRDVANLAWKLTSVVRGEVDARIGSALLDSYGAERAVHVRELTTRIKRIGAVICERDVERARERDRSLLAECGGTVRDTPRQDILPRLEHGFLSANVSSARGTIFPQPRLAGATEGQLMDDRFGCGWRLVHDATLECGSVAPPRLTLVAIGSGAVREQDGVVAEWMLRHGCHAALVRPDHYVFGVAGTDAELAGLVREWSGRLAVATSRATA